jgi:hypothetical protein
MYKFLVSFFCFFFSLFFVTNIFAQDTVTFHFDEMKTEVLCLKDVVKIDNIKVSSLENIDILEYSLDGGITWVELDPLQDYKEVNFNLPEISFDVGLLVFKMRVTVDDVEYLSPDKYIPTSCEESLILGYYFENNGEAAIITQSGDVIYNPNHKLEIVVEASYTISNVKVLSGHDSVNLDYDYVTKLWSGEIPADLLSQEENDLQILGEADGDLIKKILPTIFNVKFYIPELQSLYGRYEVYYFNEYQWKLLEYDSTGMQYPIFTLLPGKYYTRVEGESGWHYSAIFEIEEKSVVAVNMVLSELPIFLQWIERYFSPLDVALFDSSFFVMQRVREQDGGDVRKFILDKERDSLVMYINRWNPLYRQSLKFLEDAAGDYNIVLLADQNNFNSLNSGLKNYKEVMELYEVEDNDILRNYLGYQPQIMYYRVSTDTFYVIHSLSSFANLDYLLNNLE